MTKDMTASEVMQTFNIPRYMLHLWRRGEVKTRIVKGEKKEYPYKAKLKKGIHWKFNADGKIIYTPSGIAVIRQLTKKGKR